MINKYKNYKASGDQWLGSIPENWIVSSMKYHLEISGGYAFKSNDYIDNGGVPILRIGDIKPIVDSYYAKRVPYEIIEGLEAFRAKENDILVAMTGATIGKNGVYKSKEEAYVNQRVGLLRSKNDLSQTFLKYFIDTDFFKEFIKLECSGSAQENISTTDIANLKIALPTVEEQTKISQYLDNQTGLIDAIIEKKQQLINKLKEQRQAIINEAVTEGLDPDAPMKDSGVEWLGEIPEHWEVCKLKHIAQLKSGNFISANDIEQVGDYPVYGGNGLRGYTNSFTHEGNYVLIGRQGALCGNINYASGQFWATEHAVVVNLKGVMDVFYIGELLRTMNLNQYNESAAQPGLAVGKIENLWIPKNSYEDQIQISKFIRREFEISSKLISKIEIQISKLKDYRQSIISEAVTGKIDVREWEPKVKETA